MPKTEIEPMACDGFLHCVVVAIELVADGGSDEIGAVRLKALLNQEVHLTEVHVTEVDGDLFAIAHLGLSSRALLISTIPLPSGWMVYGLCSSCCKCLRSCKCLLGIFVTGIVGWSRGGADPHPSPAQWAGRPAYYRIALTEYRGFPRSRSFMPASA